MRNSKFLIGLFFISMISISKQAACANEVIGKVLVATCNCGADEGPLCEIGQICKDNTCFNKCSGDGKQETDCGCVKDTAVTICKAGQTCSVSDGQCGNPTDCTDATQTNDYCLCKQTGQETGNICEAGQTCSVSDGQCGNPTDCTTTQTNDYCLCKKTGQSTGNICEAGQTCSVSNGQCSDPTDCTDATQTDKYCLCKKTGETTGIICQTGQTCSVSNGQCVEPTDCTATQTNGYCLCKKTGETTGNICEAGQTCSVSDGQCSDPTDACTDATQTDKYCLCSKTNDQTTKEICDPGQTCSTTNGNCTNPASCTEGGNAQTSAFCLCGTKDICKKDQICYIDDETQQCEDVTTCGTGNSPTTKQCTCSNTTCLDGQLCVINGTEGECKNITDCEEGGNAQSALCKCSDNIYCQKGEVCSKGKCNAVTACGDQTGNNATEVQCTCGTATCKAGEKCKSDENKCEPENSSSSTLNRIFKIMLICTLVALF